MKRSILTSRVGATSRVVDALRSCPPEERPSVLVTASAVGFYGTSSSLRFDESSASGSDYLAAVCRDWEAAAAPAAALGTRLVVLRMGIVLDKGGGALASMAPVFQVFAGGPLGDGRQWFSWVHREDAVDIVCRALSDASFSGAYNVTAPRPVRMGVRDCALSGARARSVGSHVCLLCVVTGVLPEPRRCDGPPRLASRARVCRASAARRGRQGGA